MKTLVKILTVALLISIIIDMIDLSFEKDKDNTYELANYIPIYSEEIK